jgi:hypothetical protein
MSKLSKDPTIREGWHRVKGGSIRVKGASISEWRDNADSFLYDRGELIGEPGMRGNIPLFQRRHYIYIAKLIREAPISQPKANRMLLANKFANEFEKTEENFNRERFIKACEALDLECK